MTDHPLTETAAAEMWDGHVPPSLNFQGWARGDQRRILDALRAAFDAGREHERANPDDRPWGPLKKGDPLHVGDEVRRDRYGITSIAVVGRVDRTGDPWTAEGALIGMLSHGTWHVRRVAPELPTKCGTVIVANDGHKFIKAEVDGIAHRAREAVLGANGWWYGAWRKAEGDGLLSAMFPEHISAPTWKVDDQ